LRIRREFLHEGEQSLERADGRKIVEGRPRFCLLRILVVDGEDAVNLQSFVALACFDLQSLAVTQAVPFHDLRSHEDGTGMRLEKARRIAEEASS
jgi:hypothetical protein